MDILTLITLVVGSLIGILILGFAGWVICLFVTLLINAIGYALQGGFVLGIIIIIAALIFIGIIGA